MYWGRPYRDRHASRQSQEQQYSAGALKGQLSEECAENILYRLAAHHKIVGFRRATEEEDKQLRTDFMITLKSKREIGLQVKSSVLGVARFYQMERLRPIPNRPYAVMPFIINLSENRLAEEARMLKALTDFESLLKEKEATLFVLLVCTQSSKAR